MQYRDDILTTIAPHIHKGNLGEIDISSLVNMVRELSDGFIDITQTLITHATVSDRHI